MRLHHGFATAKYHGLEAHPCTCRWYCLTLLSDISRNKLQHGSQASKSEALREPNTKAPGVCFSFDVPPADGWGLRIGVFSRKFCERVGESQHAFWREWPCKPWKIDLISNNLSWEGGSVMLAACLQGYEEVIRDNFVWFGRWWKNLHKRNCCSTWIPRKISMEFAKDLRTIFIREDWSFPDEGILINHHIYIYMCIHVTSCNTDLPSGNLTLLLNMAMYSWSCY